MARFHLLPILLSTISFSLAPVQAQVSTFPANASSCTSNAVGSYPCVGTSLCCPLPAVCIPDYSNGNIQYICIDAEASAEGGQPAIISGGEAGLPATTLVVPIEPTVVITPTRPVTLPDPTTTFSSSSTLPDPATTLSPPVTLPDPNTSLLPSVTLPDPVTTSSPVDPVVVSTTTVPLPNHSSGTPQSVITSPVTTTKPTTPTAPVPVPTSSISGLNSSSGLTGGGSNGGNGTGSGSVVEFTGGTAVRREKGWMTIVMMIVVALVAPALGM